MRREDRDPAMSPSGFTLVEMLVVMSVIALVTVLAVPAFQTIAAGGAVERAGGLVAAQLTVARQTAAARNRAIEIRVYKYQDTASLGDQFYRGFQLFEVSPNGSKRPLDKSVRLPGTMIVSEEGALSSLVSALKDETGYKLEAAEITGNPLPEVGANYSGFAFRVRPSGATDLPDPSLNYFLTMHASTAPAAGGQPPPNYYTIQVDPLNGTVRHFRP